MSSTYTAVVGLDFGPTLICIQYYTYHTMYVIIGCIRAIFKNIFTGHIDLPTVDSEFDRLHVPILHLPIMNQKTYVM